LLCFVKGVSLGAAHVGRRVDDMYRRVGSAQ
jgi:hypothetical protein